ncbi:hypothetical protein TNCV_1284271 [Trichonephila clavipes]|uniref:Uncharacterized protein n=1 Tax=Trichonephila clavipes TaxID=2585209 RepID=A0A8X6SL56_TRICX|nr:hypothetical protein TNCV_1284271 [Trichonephila clavipes]
MPLKTSHVNGLMHIKSVEVERFSVVGVWKFGQKPGGQGHGLMAGVSVVRAKCRWRPAKGLMYVKSVGAQMSPVEVECKFGERVSSSGVIRVT